MRPSLNETSCVCILSAVLLLTSCASNREQMAFDVWDDQAIPAITSTPEEPADPVLDLGPDPALSDYAGLALSRNRTAFAAAFFSKDEADPHPQLQFDTTARSIAQPKSMNSAGGGRCLRQGSAPLRGLACTSSCGLLASRPSSSDRSRSSTQPCTVAVIW